MNSGDITELLGPVFEKYSSRIVFSYLFGSIAQGSPGPLSDIDIAVFFQKNPERSYSDLKLSLHNDLCRALKRDDVDVIVLNSITNLMLIEQIINNGRVLLDKDREFRLEFEQRMMHRVIDFKQQRLALTNV